jgi:serine/threonine-protein kinase
MIGAKLGHYVITGHLGTGGMGEVYQATDSKLGRKVALKLLPDVFSRDADRVARFEREAKVLASLNHSNIAAIYGLEESGAMRFLVLELVEGETLADRLQRGPIPVVETLKLALQIVQALEAAHDRGVIHRDIKPANIKITSDGKVKVLDFGLAKAFAADESNVNLSNSPTVVMTSMAATQEGTILGTAAYMSPEQAVGHVTDKRTDIWAFGVVLFEMLSGRALFSGKTVSHIIADVLKSDPDWKSLPANLHPRVRMLLERCLEKDARDRYHDIADARVDIERVRDNRGGVVQPVSESAAPSRIAGLRFVLPLVAVAVVAFGLGWFLRPVPEARPGVVHRSTIALPDSTRIANPLTSDVLGNYSALTISSDGTKVAYAADTQLYLYNFDDPEMQIRPVQGTNEGGATASPVLSPDGQRLTYIHLVTNSGPYIIKQVPVAGGTPKKVLELKEGLTNFPWGLSWPAQDKLVFVNGDGIVQMHPNGGPLEVLVKRGAGEAFESPQILPGGKQVLFVRLPQDPARRGIERWDDADIVIQSVGGNDRAVVVKGGSHARYLATGHLLYAQGNTLFAGLLDLNSRRVVGSPVSIRQGVRRSANGFTDAAQYAVSETGTLVTIPAPIDTTSQKGVLATRDRNENVTMLSPSAARYRSPRFSPNGQRLAVEILGDDGTSSIWIHDPSRDSDIRKLAGTGKNNTRPVWRDDMRLTFGSDRDGSWGIYDQAVDGDALPKQLIKATGKEQLHPEAWSPDGKTLAYVKLTPRPGPDRDLNLDIYTLDVASGVSSMFADGNTPQFGSSFSRDGKRIAYTDATEPFGIRVRPFPGSGIAQEITHEGEAWPVWLPSGEMWFRRRRDTDLPNELKGVVLTFSTSGEPSKTNLRSLELPDVLFFQYYRDYDVTRDGEKFVVIVPEQKEVKGDLSSSQRHIDVVENWQEELKQLDPVQ